MYLSYSERIYFFPLLENIFPKDIVYFDIAPFLTDINIKNYYIDDLGIETFIVRYPDFYSQFRNGLRHGIHLELLYEHTWTRIRSKNGYKHGLVEIFDVDDLDNITHFREKSIWTSSNYNSNPIGWSKNIKQKVRFEGELVFSDFVCIYSFWENGKKFETYKKLITFPDKVYNGRLDWDKLSPNF